MPTLIKLKNETKHFKANQKVILVNLTGSNRCEVRGRHKVSGRYIKAWINKKDIKIMFEMEERLND